MLKQSSIQEAAIIKISLLLLFMFQGCGGSTLEEVIIEPEKIMKLSDEFRVEEILPDMQWTHVLIVNPYTDYEAVNREKRISIKVKKILNENRLNDQLVTLVWYNEKMTVGYTDLKRKILDFTSVANQKGIISLEKTQQLCKRKQMVVFCN